jgi:hypothetical protein
MGTLARIASLLLLDNVSVTTGGGPNQLTNGDFEGGVGPVPTVPAGWTHLDTFGVDAAGRLRSECGVGGFSLLV